MNDKLSILGRLVEEMGRRAADKTTREEELCEKDRHVGLAGIQAGQVVQSLNSGALGQLRSQLRPLNLNLDLEARDHSSGPYGPTVEVVLGFDGAIWRYAPDLDMWEILERVSCTDGTKQWGNYRPFSTRAEFAEKVQAHVSAMLETGSLEHWIKHARTLN